MRFTGIIGNSGIGLLKEESREIVIRMLIAKTWIEALETDGCPARVLPSRKIEVLTMCLICKKCRNIIKHCKRENCNRGWITGEICDDCRRFEV